MSSLSAVVAAVEVAALRRPEAAARWRPVVAAAVRKPGA